jgi:ATP-dependent DNA helicase RecQ
VRTVLTYLEPLGVVRQGTPFYASYEAKPLAPLETIFVRFSGEPRQFLERVFGAAKKGRIWYGLDATDVAARLGVDRERILRALRYLEEHELIELRATEPRLRFTRVDGQTVDAVDLVLALAERFERREAQEIERIQQVLALATHAGCQTQALVGYFGERLAGPCGHCSYCETSSAPPLPSVAASAGIAERLDRTAFTALCTAHPDALGEPRQQARFLCGLTSPRASHARLSRHPLFGVLDGARFADVLAWCAELPRPSPPTELAAETPAG